jgi:glycosyltransferase involved in cell wall biosynthesis
MTNKKICIIGPFPPYKGGISQYDEHLAKELIKSADVCIFSYKRQYPKFLIKNRDQIDDNYQDNNGPKLNINFSLDSINPFTWLSTIKKIRDESPDLILLPWWVIYWAPMYLVFLVTFRILNIKTLLLCHNIYEHEDHHIKRTITKIVFKLANYYLVHSSSEKNKLLPLIGKKKYIQHLHPLYRFSPTKHDVSSSYTRKNRLNLLFFGFVREYKGLDILLEAMHILNDNNIHLNIVGEFWSGKEEFINYIEQKKIANVIIINHYIPDDEVEKHFLEADVVVLPYRSATGSGVIATSYGFNKPVLATNVGGLPDAVDNYKTGLIVEPEPEKIAEGIMWFKSHHHDDFSENISIFTKNHMSWGSLCTQILKLV